MIVEYFGLSGSGKSYLSEKLSKEKNIPIVEIHGRWEKFLHAFLFVVRHPFFFLYVTMKTMREPNTSLKLWKHKYFLLFLFAIAKEHKAEKMHSAVITDGLYQFGLSLFEEVMPEEKLERYVRKLKKLPDRELYIVRADDEVRKERMQKRKRIPRSKFGEKYARRFQETIAVNLETLSRLVPHKTVYNNPK